MGYEVIGECYTPEKDRKLKSYQMELTIKHIKEACGRLPRGVDVEIIWQDHELGSYPVIAVVWDDYATSYPNEYIGKCIKAYERLSLPEEIRHKTLRVTPAMAAGLSDHVWSLEEIADLAK